MEGVKHKDKQWSIESEGKCAWEKYKIDATQEIRHLIDEVEKNLCRTVAPTFLAKMFCVGSVKIDHVALPKPNIYHVANPSEYKGISTKEVLKLFATKEEREKGIEKVTLSEWFLNGGVFSIDGLMEHYGKEINKRCVSCSDGNALFRGKGKHLSLKTKALTADYLSDGVFRPVDKPNKPINVIGTTGMIINETEEMFNADQPELHESSLDDRFLFLFPKLTEAELDERMLHDAKKREMKITYEPNIDIAKDFFYPRIDKIKHIRKTATGYEGYISDVPFESDVHTKLVKIVKDIQKYVYNPGRIFDLSRNIVTMSAIYNDRPTVIDTDLFFLKALKPVLMPPEKPFIITLKLLNSGKTQEEVAALLNLNQSTISRIAKSAKSKKSEDGYVDIN